MLSTATSKCHLACAPLHPRTRSETISLHCLLPPLHEAAFLRHFAALVFLQCLKTRFHTAGESLGDRLFISAVMPASKVVFGPGLYPTYILAPRSKAKLHILICKSRPAPTNSHCFTRDAVLHRPNCRTLPPSVPRVTQRRHLEPRLDHH
ncbi:hypothetical protein M405DRAFT_476194 [Rhizopogon salebrosus TDB-379]|nr:hypothetical protein M405DRAFT_476194 [Rhizopogon salebrosus TDB-379]